MDHEITTIPLIPLEAAVPITRPDRKNYLVTLEDPAMDVMTDFNKIMPVTVEPVTSIDLALSKMKTYGVRLLLVTDQSDHIAGVITSYDIQSEKPIKYAEETGLERHRISVEMIMTPIGETPVFDYDFIRQATVKHVINTMKALQRAHTLVIENPEQGDTKIRGMFSTSQVSKMMGRSVYEPLHATNSLAELQQELNRN